MYNVIGSTHLVYNKMEVVVCSLLAVASIGDKAILAKAKAETCLYYQAVPSLDKNIN